MLVNSSAAFSDSYVLAQFDCSYTTLHSRVRRATVKPADQVDTRELDLWLAQTYRMLRWASRGDRPLRVGPGRSVDVGELRGYDGFGSGWSPPEEGGIWTTGPRSDLTISVEDVEDGGYVLILDLGMICVGRDDLLRVTMFANGERVSAREFAFAHRAIPWRLELPASAWDAGRIELSLGVDEPRSPLMLGWSEDDRPLGIHIRTLSVEQLDRRVEVGEDVVFSEGSGAERLLGEGWWQLEPTGVWTAGEEARLSLRFSEDLPAEVELVLDALPFLTTEHSSLDVAVWAGEERVAEQTFRYGKSPRPLRIPLTDGVVDEQRRALLALRLDHPARPVELGAGTDPRRLGLHLRSLTVQEPAAGLTTNGAITRLRALLGRG